ASVAEIPVRGLMPEKTAVVLAPLEGANGFVRQRRSERTKNNVDETLRGVCTGRNRCLSAAVDERAWLSNDFAAVDHALIVRNVRIEKRFEAVGNCGLSSVDRQIDVSLHLG